MYRVSSAGAALKRASKIVSCWRSSSSLDLGWFLEDQVRDRMSALGILSGRDFPLVGPQAAPLPGRGDLQMPTVTLPGGYETAEPGRPAPNGEDIMPFDGGVISSPRKSLTQGVTHRDRRGIDEARILHATKRTRQVDLLSPRICQGPLGQGFHELFQGHIESLVESGPRRACHLTLQVRTQDLHMIGVPGVPAAITMARMNTRGASCPVAQ